MSAPIAAVVFDVGETLFDENRVWARWADWIGVSHLTFFSVLGATIARGQPHRHAFDVVAPGFSPEQELQRRRAAGEDDREPTLSDLYPDVLDALRELKAAGFVVAAAGNQFRHMQAVLAAVEPGFDMIGTSESWGIEKPDVAFFERIASELGLTSGEIAYVGDRLDNDIYPAATAGMQPFFVRRGPWGHIQSDADAAHPGITVSSLRELLPALRALNTERGSAR